MNNINECRCITVHNLRQHHGVVCTTCNPNRIEKLVVPGTVTGYRVWKFDHQHGFRNTTGRKRGWSEFNSVLPPGFGDELDYMKPWSGAAKCLYNDHKSPNPYCSCGYYSINKFGNNSRQAFGHDASETIVKDFQRLLPSIDRHDDDTRQALTELLFYSPVAKTLEINSFNLLSEVELTGTIIECEKGYRSEFVTPKKMFLLLDIDKLFGLINFIGKRLEKHQHESLHVTYEWAMYINNYLTNIMKLYGLDFELRFKYEPDEDYEYEMLTGDQSKGSDYLPFKDHPFIYTKVKEISEYMKNSDKFLRYKYPGLDLMLEKLTKDKSNVAYLDDRRNSLSNRYRRNKWIGSPITLGNYMRRDHIAEFFENYAGYLLSFAHFNCMLGEQKNDRGNLLSYPNLTQQFGFMYHTFLENRYSAREVINKHFIAQEHPSLWFKNIYPYFEQYLEKIGRNSLPTIQEVNFDER